MKYRGLLAALFTEQFPPKELVYLCIHAPHKQQSPRCPEIKESS